MYTVTMLLSNPYRPDPRVQKEAISLINSGYRVNLICWDRKSEFPGKEVVNGIEVLRIRVPSEYNLGSRQLLNFLRFWIVAYKQLDKTKPDIVHCHDLDTALLGYWYKRTHPETKFVYDAHECYPAQIGPQVAKWMKLFLRKLDNFITRRSDLVITVSETLADYFRSMNGKTSVVGNYQTLSARTSQPEITRKDIGYSDNDYLIGYFGGFTPARAVIPLIQAAAKYPLCKFLFAGDGILRPQIEDGARKYENITYLGWLPQEFIMAYTTLVDVIYYGLFKENKNSEYSSPNSLFNAMLVGKPILTTDVGEISTIVKRENCGLVIEYPTPELILEKLRELSNQQLRLELGENGRQAAEDKYNWEEAEVRLLNDYASLFY